MAAAPALYFVIQDRADLVHNAQLPGLRPVLEDRARLRERPALHPRVLQLGHPQVVWIRADDAEGVTLDLAGHTFGPAARIGPGLFRLPLELPPNLPAGSTQVELHLDGASHVRAVEVVPRIERPRDVRPAPGGGSAVALETDTLLRFGDDGLTRLPVGDGPVAAVITTTAGFVAHRYDPFVWRTHPEPAPHLRVGRDQTDLDLRDGQLAVVVRAPPALFVGPAAGPLVRVPLPVAPDRVRFVGDALVVASRHAQRLDRLRRGPEGWRLDGEPLRLGRPVTALASFGHHLVVAASDYRPRGDAGDNHAVREQLLRVDVEAWRVAARRPIFDRAAEPPCAGVTYLHADADGLWGTCQGTQARFRVPDPMDLDAALQTTATRLAAPSGFVFTERSEIELSWALGRLSGFEAPSQVGADLREGAVAFTLATRSGASCATCHPDADSDHALHEIGHAAPRPTLSVRGLANTAPFLRGASYPTLDGLDHFAQTILEGYEDRRPNHAAALEAFVRALPPPFVPGRHDTRAEDLRAGYAAFVRAGCHGCHPGPAFTNLAQIPQPMLFPEQPSGVLLDVPSLIGVAATPPYLFDGRAETLRAVFENHDRAHRHGRYDQLAPQERAALLRLLEAL